LGDNGDDRLLVSFQGMIIVLQVKPVKYDGKMYKEYYGKSSEFSKGTIKMLNGKKIMWHLKGIFPNTIVLEDEQDLTIFYFLNARR